jgi:hypothetical protein
MKKAMQKRLSDFMNTTPYIFDDRHVRTIRNFKVISA